MTAQTTRSEHDLLGDRNVPIEAYFGVHTLRAGTAVTGAERARRPSRHPMR